jgi:ATP-dependent Clp protease ATP-binding subunit ClpC
VADEPPVDPYAQFKPGARRLIEAALLAEPGGSGQAGLHHWLITLCERHGPMAESVARGLDHRAVLTKLRQQVREGQRGEPLAGAAVAARASELALARGNEGPAERDVAAAILALAGYELQPPGGATNPNTAQAPSATQPESATPTLDRFGRDLTKAARDGKLPAVVGRDDEIQLVVETLCRRTKRNPVLVGPAGVGKTAIVEALAQRIVRDGVPRPLKDARLVSIQPSSLVAGSGVVGELDKRVGALLAEASQPGVLLFIDEFHSVVGAGGREGTGDLASLLKPALARGDIACIAATTDEEYRRFVEGDAALERRFQPVMVGELGPAATVGVLRTTRAELCALRQVEVDDDVLEWLVEFADLYLPMRRFPDKAIDLLEQSVAFAVSRNRARVERSDAEAVAQRMVGMPLDLDARREKLRSALLERGLLREQDVQALVDLLAVTGRGLDVRPNRPNAVVLLTGELGEHADVLGETIAETLFGSETRLVAIDLSRIAHGADLTLLTGAPPGYVGYHEGSPLQKVAHMPWCVLRFDNAHACHPQAQAVLAQALADGRFAAASGRAVPLSNAIVLLTAEVEANGRKAPVVGFNPVPADDPASASEPVERALGRDLAAQIDLVWSSAPASKQGWRAWLERHLLEDLRGRYQRQGLELAWEAGVVEWLLEREVARPSRREWERVVDQHLNPVLVASLGRAGGKGRITVRRLASGLACDVHPA